MAALVIDALVMLAGSFVAYVAAGYLGAWSIDDEWLAQYDENPDVWPNIPALHVDLTLILVVSVAIAAAIVLYSAACWARFSALPGQRALGLRVLDYDTGRRLSFPAALRRSLGLFGSAGVVVTLYAVLSFERLAELPVGDTSGNLVSPTSSLEPWLDPIAFGLFLGSVWLIMVLASTIVDRLRRGAQDRMAGSIVVAVRTVPAWYQSFPFTGPAPQPGSAAGPRPQPGWTPPGSWTPPGQPAPIDWRSQPGQPAQPGQPYVPDQLPTNTPDTQPPSDAETSSDGNAVPDAETSQETPPWKREVDDRPVSLAGHEAATVGRRVAAYGIDCLIVLVLFLTAFATLLPDSSSTGTWPNERISIFAGLAGGAMQLVYFVLGWTFWRATLGQRLVGVAVVGERGGKAISAMDAVTRWAVLQGPFALVTVVPLAVAPVVAFVAACWSAVLLYSTQSDEDCRGLHDRFVGTRVVVA